MKKIYITTGILGILVVCALIFLFTSLKSNKENVSGNVFSEEYSVTPYYITATPTPKPTKAPTPTSTPTPTCTPTPTKAPTPVYNLTYKFTEDVYDEKISVNNSEYKIPEATLNNLNSLIDSYGNKCSFYLVDIGTRATFAYNAEGVFRSGSVVKLPYMLWAYKEVAAGNISLDTRLKYKSEYYHVGSGTIRYDAEAGNAYDYSTEYLFHNIIQISDNIAYHMSVVNYGVTGYNNMLSELGCTDAGKTTLYSMWPSFTTRDLALTWDEIYRFKDESEAGQIYWKDLLVWKCSFVRDYFDGLGDKTPIASKSGWYSKGYNDSAMVLTEHPYIIVVMTDSPGEAVDQRFCLKLTRALIAMMNEYQSGVYTD